GAFVATHDLRGAAVDGERPIRSVFIANRGEIAVRIARTCRRLGITALMPSTEGPNALDLLDLEAVVAAAVASEADALHPGVGFLAENAQFADAVARAGLAWVGPPSAAIRAMGDKAAARRLAASLGIPVLAGYDEADQADAALAGAAGRIGFPVLVKPAAGGGGKGMRIVREPSGLLEALAAARREAMAAFGDDRLILERLVEGGRHVEIQVLFDAAGQGVQLGERDCSVQRRHQKVLEEAPSPAVDGDLRQRLGDAALALGRAVGYVGAGTCEFLVDEHGSFSFLEMNTRLQVEHPVTELVTGRDLVADQLRIAAGARLDLPDGTAPPATGHAVEVRLYAEDAEDGFLPATGRVEMLRWPSGDGIRVDAGIEVGTEIGGRFDPMLAKLIAWGPDRPGALRRLAAALDGTVLLGVVTNLRFLRWLVRQPVVLAGDVRTDTLDRLWPPDDWSERTAIPDDAWAAAAAAAGPAADADPWGGGWRLNAERSIRLEADGVVRSVTPAQGPATVDRVVVGDVVHLDVAGRSVAFRLAPPPDVANAARAAMAHHTLGELGPAEVIAPMPGAVVSVYHAAGDQLEAGDAIVTLEAMKMEHAVTAPIAGRLAELRVRPADQVVRGQVLAIVEP
ncbi:MAG: ATP-grasp domain-containing protein, partial [Chloroflexi bacterium]|nr:ATP-grasp domain-containing protein [Chloroflexota bacterium]